ncbi:MAG: bacteriochlorophyll/chlorophyll a synthase, partial [Pseudomonadota bacterium]
AQVACAVMAAPQAVVIALLALWDRPLHAAGVALVLLLQFWAMRIMFRDPKAKAPWYNGTGVLLYVSGMMVAAFALRGLS